MEDKKIADYFVVAGYTDKSMPLEDFSFDGSQLKSTYDQPPITDITVIIPSFGEMVPNGFVCLEYTPTGLPADLNFGSLRSPEVFLCYRRGRDRPPLFDIGVLYQGKERVMSDSEVVLSTPYGRPANVNNSVSQHTYLTYRRAPETAPCNDLVVSDICVVVTSKGEQPPHAYCMIKKNLNKGMLGSDVYLCYKKSMNKPRYIAYRPGIQARYPEEDISNFPMPDSVPLFCLPMGATLEWWPIQAATPKPVFSTFVLTVSDAAEKVYGSAVTFYERYPEEKMSKEQRAWLDMEDFYDESAPKDYTVNTIKSICILSHWPFFDTFEKFLRFLHKMAHTGPHLVPIERYISHFLHDVPFPSPQRPRILIQLSAEDRIALAQPEELPLPRRGASFRHLLLNLGPDGCLLLLLLTLTEQKILIHSLRPDVLTATAEALVTCIFPFKWQCPYIPLCPLGLSDVLNAPLPYLIGVDSRFFDMYDPPSEVSCIDLDTNTISLSEEKKSYLSVKLFPKKPARILRNTLQNLYERIYLTHWSERGKRDVSDSDEALEKTFKIKNKELLLELDIQEAFLKFMASILQGYRSFLLPITKAPTIGATDPNSLFDLQGFLRSRDKAHVKFYMLLMKTQMFIRFIEERSFVSDMDSSLAFFDECSDKTDLDEVEVKLLELDESHQSERTVFITPPEPVGLSPSVTYTYDHFGTLNSSLMSRPADSLDNPNTVGNGLKLRANSGMLAGVVGPSPSSPLARRTKHEIKNSQKFAKKYAETPMLWAKCLLSTCFSIWFIHLPSLVLESNSKVAAMRAAYDILVAMQKLRLLPADEVCYRVMMQLCGVYSQPVLAVRVLFEMKRHGMQPNAITYGFYNKAVLEAHWSSDMANHSRLLWNKLRNVVTAAALFRKAGRAAAQQRISLYSSNDECDLASGSDGDGLSRTSVDSAQENHHAGASLGLSLGGGVPIVYRNSTVASSQSDIGYSSMVEGQTLKGKSSSQRDLPNDVKIEANSITGGKRAAAVLQLDFSQSDQFRSRVGSIVKTSANTIPDQSVESAAGVLMSSLGNNNGTTISADEATQLKTALDVSPPKDQQPRGATLPREKTSAPEASSAGIEGQQTPTPAESSSQTKTNNHSTSTSSLFRSTSLKLGGILSSPLEHLNPSSRSAIANRLQWARSSIRKRLDMNPVEPPKKVVESKLNGDAPPPTPPTIAVADSSTIETNGTVEVANGRHEEIDEPIPEEIVEEIVTNGTLLDGPSPRRMTLTHGDPLGALDIVADDIPRAKVSTSNNFVVTPDPSMRLFADHHSSEESEDDDQPYDDNQTPKLSLSRYGGARWSLRKPDFRVNLGAQVLGTALNSLSPQNLNARKAELMVGFSSLKSAASSVAKKIDEIKGAIGGTPGKTGSGLNPEPERMGSTTTSLTVDDGSQESWGSWTAHWLRRASSADLTAQYPGQTSSGSPSEWSSSGDGPTNSNTRSVPSLTSISGHLDRLCLSMRGLKGKKRCPIAVEVVMTSCSKCHNCLSILYDEEIMAGWTPEDSNLNTRCQHCKKLLVPFLTIHVKDYRSHPSSTLQQLCSNLSPGVSQESVLSLSTQVIQRKESEDLKEGKEEVVGKLVGEVIEEAVEEVVVPDIQLDPLTAALNAKVPVAPVITPMEFGPITVPYLSPLVLRRELENILEQEGDVCLTQSSFVDQHPILYWNMLWFFERVGLMSHMAALILKANVGLNAAASSCENDIKNRIDSSWMSADERNVSIKTKWDNPILHDEIGPPCYSLWRQTDEQRSPLVSALVTEYQPIPRSLMQQLVSGIQYNDMLRPLKLLSTELIKRKTKSGTVVKHHGIYRELLFLTFVAIDRENIDQVAFDREYRLAYDRLDPQCVAMLGKVDSPPSIASVFCRHFFRQLEI